MKRILITGENSYIGTKFKEYMNQWPQDYEVTEISVRGNEWKNHDFGQYDVVFHVAGIVHQKETRRNRKDYFNINRDLAFEVAQHSKKYGVSQFVFLSSMSVYGMKTGVITKETVPNPKSAYGQSKLEAELLIQNLNDDQFTVTILRPPMVYGPGCKGNYQTLSKFAKITPIFPNFSNKRSMVFIDNLLDIIKECTDNNISGVLHPANRYFVNTSDMVKKISNMNGKKVLVSRVLSLLTYPVKEVGLFGKIFGDLIYTEDILTYSNNEVGLVKSLQLSENIETGRIWFFHHYATPPSLNGFTRTYEFSKRLVKEDFHCTTFSSSYLHFSDHQLIPDRKRCITLEEDDVEFVFVKTLSGSSGLKRVLNMLSFHFNLVKISKSLIKKYGAPDVIISSSPHLLTFYSGYKLSKTYNIKFVTEVRDFWPEVFFINGVISENGIIGKILLLYEKLMYKYSNAIIFLKEGDHQYLLERGWSNENGGSISLDKVFYINNGVDLKKFDLNLQEYDYQDVDLESDKFIVTYAGSIRSVNNLDFLIKAAELLKADEDILFLIYGEGDFENKLKDKVKQLGLANIKFKGYLESQYIPSLLSKSSVNVLNYSQKKYNWSRGNSSNKLFEYMAAGKPIISTVKMGYCPLDKYKCGLSVEENVFEFVEILKMLSKNTKLYEQMSNNARLGSLDYEYGVLTKKFKKVMEYIDVK